MKMKDSGDAAATAEGAEPSPGVEQTAAPPETGKEEPEVAHNDGVPTTRDRLLTQFQGSSGRQADAWTALGRLVQHLGGPPMTTRDHVAQRLLQPELRPSAHDGPAPP